MRAINCLPVLLVGASGRVGTMVKHHWTTAVGHSNIVSQFRRGNESRGCIVWDPMRGPQKLLEAVSETGGFSTMIILAGVTPGPDKDLSLNRDLAEACLDAASCANIQRVLLASSSAVYGVGTGIPLTETAKCRPANPYGCAKLEMEYACAQWRSRGIDLCILRIGNVAGADALLLNSAQADAGEAIEIDIFDDGRGPVRSYIGVRTLASVLHALCNHPSLLPDVVNVGSPYPISMDELADAASQPWKRRTPSKATHQRITLDNKLLASLYDFNSMDSCPEEMVRQWKETLNQ